MNIVEKIKKIYTFDSRRKPNQTYFDSNEVGSEGFGETGFKSIEALISNYKEIFNEDAVFYDLGSGTGKIVYHIGHLYNIKKSCGIEYSKERHELGLSIKEKYDLPDNDKISLINANILDCDISDSTIIYCDNTLFPVWINKNIYEKIPNGCVVFSKSQISKNKKEYIKLKDFRFISDYGTDSLYMFVKNNDLN
jgi:hypothetical protein